MSLSTCCGTVVKECNADGQGLLISTNPIAKHCSCPAGEDILLGNGYFVLRSMLEVNAMFD